MVDSIEEGDSYVADNFEPDIDKDIKLGKVEGELSFYECPTAAASIQGFTDTGRIYHSSSCNSDNDYVIDSYETGLENTDGGSVSFSQLRYIQGGYFGGYSNVSYPTAGKVSKKPQSFINKMNINLNTNPTNVTVVNNEQFAAPSPSSNPNLQIDNNYSPPQGDVTTNTPHTLYNAVDGSSTPVSRHPYNVVEGSSTPVSQLNGCINTSPPYNVVEGSSTPSFHVNAVGSSTPQLPSNAMENSVLNTPSMKDYSRATVCGNKSETTFVQEGYDTISIPRYRPIEIVEKTVEVPVIHHVDTFVPKKEIQEIESIIKKPYTKYVDKIVEVPQIHYTDCIVEVPEYHEVTKTIPKIEVQERTKYVPKIEVKIIPKYVEVPIVKFIDKYQEVEEVEEVVRHVEKKEIIQVPKEVVKHVVKPVKKIIEQERIVPVIQHRDVPIEKVKFVPKIETVELVRQVPQIIDVPVPYNVPKVEIIDEPYIVPKYNDIPVAVPVLKKVKPVYKYNDNVEYIDVPVHKPYFVIHDHINFKPVSKDYNEHLTVVGMNKIDLNTLNQQHKQEAQQIINDAIQGDKFKLYRDTMLNDNDVYPSSANTTPRNNVNQQDKNKE